MSDVEQSSEIAPPCEHCTVFVGDYKPADGPALHNVVVHATHKCFGFELDWVMNGHAFARAPEAGN